MSDPYAVAYLHRRQQSTPSSDLPPAAHQLPKQQSQKKPTTGAGSGKGKGSVRAKSGCYTCRIRRKKCDEQRDANDNCQTCVRLRLECLGFGTKRPDWMRENNSVPDLREKIKQFLASQGMIKGHSGSGSRNVDSSQPGPILILSEIGHTKQRNAPSSGGPQAANATSGARSAGSSAASSPQSPRSPPVPPSTLYHQPPPSHYSPPHSHSAHGEPRYPHVNTSYARDPPRSDLIPPYSPISPDLPTPATATSTAAPGLGHGHHGHHGHGDPYSSTHSPEAYGHRQSINSQDSLHFNTLPPVRTADGNQSRAGRRLYPDSIYGGDRGRRSPKSSDYHNYSTSYSHHSPHSPTLSSSYSQSQSYPSSLQPHPNTSYPSTYSPASPMSPHQSSYFPGNYGYAHQPTTAPLDLSRQSTIREIEPVSPGHRPPPRVTNSGSLYSPQITPSAIPSTYDRTNGQFSNSVDSSNPGRSSSYTRSDGIAKVEPIEDRSLTSQRPYPPTTEQPESGVYIKKESLKSPSQEQPYSSGDSHTHTSPVDTPMTLPSQTSPTQSFNTSPAQATCSSPVYGAMTPEQAALLARTPLVSSLSPLYTRHIAIDPEPNESQESDNQVVAKLRNTPDQSIIESQYIGYYLTDVLSRQYVFADKGDAQAFLFQLSQSSKVTKDAMCLLSALHMHCMKQLDDARTNRPILNLSLQRSRPGPSFHDWASVNYFFKRVTDALGISLEGSEAVPPTQQYNEGDAMAGLHTISGFLFSGGRGPWPVFLDVAMQWVESRLATCNHSSDLLVNATPSQQFIARTTFWFDVWGSITQRRQPRFMRIYRELFGNAPTAFIGDVPARHLGPINMVNIIGCSNNSFRAMAEIANLSAWREEKIRAGMLSVGLLAERAREIEANWLTVDNEQTPTGENESNLDFQRHIASEVFRASARVYLHMVLSQAFPQSPEIKEGVTDTVELLQRIPHEDVVNTTAIVRSVISAICICGCLTEDKEQMEFFLRRLDSLGDEADLIGNCRVVKLLIERVWALRVEHRLANISTPVDWREVLLEDSSDVPLLV